MKTIPNYFDHPVLAELCAAIAEAEANHAAVANAARALSHANRIDSSAWVSRIEAALGDPDKLECLRIERAEQVMSIESHRMAYSIARRRIFDSRSRLNGACEAAYEHLDGIKRDNVEEFWLKPMLMNNILIAAELHRKDFDESPCGDNRGLDDEALAALNTAFTAVVEAIAKAPKCHTTNAFIGHSFVALHPIDPVTPPKKAGLSHNGIDLRAVQPVPFVDCVNSQHPALVKLAELLPQLWDVRYQMFQVARGQKQGEKGRVNEKSYADRMVQILNGTMHKGYAENLTSQQQTLRLDYQSARLELLASIARVENLRRDVAKTLREAIVETQALLEQNSGKTGYQDIVTVDVLESRRLALINCIAADSALRQIGRDLQEMHKELEQDLTEGRGMQALQKACDGYGSFYRTRRLDQKWHAERTGGSSES